LVYVINIRELKHH